jgi:trk system potassium uptake protein TrkA
MPAVLLVGQLIGIETIFNPEELAAEMFAKQMEMRGVVESFDLSEDCSILEIEVPERYLERSIGSIDFEDIYDLKLIAIKRFKESKNIFGMQSQRSTVDYHLQDEYELDEKDILVMMGEIKNFKKMVGRDLR